MKVKRHHFIRCQTWSSSGCSTSSLYTTPPRRKFRASTISLHLTRPSIRITISCDPEGDYLALSSTEREMAAPSLRYGTLFDLRRPKLPLIDLGEPRLKSPDEYPAPNLIPLVPQTAAGSFSSWIWGAPKSLRGPEVDALCEFLRRYEQHRCVSDNETSVAGPDRPPARPIRSESPEASRQKDPTARVIRHKGIAPAKQPEARPDLYSRLRSAAAERG